MLPFSPRSQPTSAAPQPDPAVIERLRARMRTIEGFADDSHRARTAVPLGLSAIDQVLPWRGLPLGAVHEIVACDESAAAAGFAAVLLGRFAGDGREVLWCRRDRGLYGPGLTAFGLDPARLLLVYAGSETEVLWTIEEALRCASLAAVLAESRVAAPMAVRRLQLAAEGSGTAALVLRPCGLRTADGPAVSRWQVTSALSLPLRASSPLPHTGEGRGESESWEEGETSLRRCWRLTLARCRGAATGSWLVRWHHETHRLTLAAELCDRSVASPLAVADQRRAG